MENKALNREWEGKKTKDFSIAVQFWAQSDLKCNKQEDICTLNDYHLYDKLLVLYCMWLIDFIRLRCSLNQEKWKLYLV